MQCTMYAHRQITGGKSQRSMNEDLEQCMAQQGDLLKARPRSMAIRLLHGESSTSTAKRPSSQHRSEVNIRIIHMYMATYICVNKQASMSVYVCVCMYVCMCVIQKQHRMHKNNRPAAQTELIGTVNKKENKTCTMAERVHYHYASGAETVASVTLGLE